MDRAGENLIDLSIPMSFQSYLPMVFSCINGQAPLMTVNMHASPPPPKKKKGEKAYLDTFFCGKLS